MLTNKRIIPILLLKDGLLYKTTKFKNPSYVGDPLNTVRIFNEKEADEIMVLDTSVKVRDNGPDFYVLQKIAEEMLSPASYGGGICNIKQAEKILSLGFEKISLCTAVYTNPSLIKQCIMEFGAQAIVACIDVRKNFFGELVAYVVAGSIKVRIGFNEYVKIVSDLGVGEIIVNDISRDGTLLGYDLELFKHITMLSDTSIIASGGARSLGDIKSLFANTNVVAAAVGSLFVYYGKNKAVLISYPLKNEKLEVLSNL